MLLAALLWFCVLSTAELDLKFKLSCIYFPIAYVSYFFLAPRVADEPWLFLAFMAAAGCACCSSMYMSYINNSMYYSEHQEFFSGSRFVAFGLDLSVLMLGVACGQIWRAWRLNRLAASGCLAAARTLVCQGFLPGDNRVLQILRADRSPAQHHFIGERHGS